MSIKPALISSEGLPSRQIYSKLNLKSKRNLSMPPPCFGASPGISYIKQRNGEGS